GPSLKAWQEMRAELDTPEHRASVREAIASPNFEKNQKAIADALEKALEEAERNKQHSIY
ncbi:MAG TPA: hypothetical protein VD770_02000, partial [Coxiellaceae bacterium]|nr:hypothetical protein [Coxiellaceae bacterium]